MSDESNLLRDALAARLGRTSAADAWTAMGEMGLHGLTLSEADGGAGADLRTAAAVAGVLGDLCLPTPFIESCMAARLVAGATSGAAARVRAALLAGQQIALVGLEPRLADTLAVSGSQIDGTAKLVLDADSADLFLMPIVADDGAALWLAARNGGVSVSPYPTIDGRMAGDVSFTATTADCLTNAAGDAIAATRDEAIALLATEAAALMASLVRQTTDYARQREQFGQAIGSFQAVQHRIVDMHIAARRAAAIARAAVAACDSAFGPERTRTISAAKATINETGRFVGQNAVQLHGGMGMTEELAVGRYFKRLTMIETQLGSTHDHVRRYAEAMAVA